MPQSLSILRNSENRYDRVSFSGRKHIRPLRPGPSLQPVEETSPGSLDHAFVRCVLRESGIDPSAYRLAPLLRRVPSCLRKLRVESVRAALRAAEAQPSLWKTAAESLLIGSTSFFRDATVFDVLEGVVIPQLLQRTGCPKVWSAACSDGAELYSMAMLLLDQSPDCAPVLQGSDCREAAIRSARTGTYTATQVASVPAAFQQKFFETQDGTGHLRFRQELLASLTWVTADLADARPPALWDVILCRNLAIYLTPAASRRLWKQLCDELEPGGFLIVGKADKPSVSGLTRIAPSVYQRNF